MLVSCFISAHRKSQGKAVVLVCRQGTRRIDRQRPPKPARSRCSFAHQVSLAKQTYHPGDGGAGTLSNTGGMVVVNGSAAFEFRAFGLELDLT